MTESDRYAARPFRRLIECFALDCIDALDPAQRAALEEMAPKLSEALGREGTWQEVVCAQMNWGEGIEAAVRDLWTRNSELARAEGIEMSPEEFAMLFAEANTTNDASDN